jgi:DNA-binding transcriptional LysR family regulator
LSGVDLAAPVAGCLIEGLRHGLRREESRAGHSGRSGDGSKEHAHRNLRMSAVWAAASVCMALLNCSNRSSKCFTIGGMNTLRAVDLNLLVILDALLEERHVSRAAVRLNLSQPATSGALARCRRLFDDPLLERRDGAMHLTSKGEELHRKVGAVLAEARTLIDRAAPRVEDLQQNIRIVTADHMAFLIGRALYPRLKAAAPGVTLTLLPWNGAPAALEDLAKGAADLAVSLFPDASGDFRKAVLLRERWVVLLRRGHPAAADFDLQRWLAYPHILMSGAGEARAPLDERLAELDLARRIGVVVPSFLMAPTLVAASDMIAMIPSRCLPPAADQRFEVLKPPIDIPDFSLHLTWHVRREHDVGVGFVRDLLLDLDL